MKWSTFGTSASSRVTMRPFGDTRKSIAWSSSPKTSTSTIELSYSVPPPKVVWINRGNCSTRDLANLLRERHQDLLVFDGTADAGLLVLA